MAGSGDIDQPCLFVVQGAGKEGQKWEGKVGSVTGGKVSDSSGVFLCDGVIEGLFHVRLPLHIWVM